MNKFKFTVELTERSQEDAKTKIAGLMALASKLTAKEVKGLANVVENDPQTTEMAKQFLGLNK